MSPETGLFASATTVAVAGNPNTGKSTLFNVLTGLSQQVGNYPGVTVERKQGTFRVDSAVVTLVDLPGAYSLAAASPDEAVVVDVLSGRFLGEARPQAVLCVADATNLRRNLFLASQIAETGLPVVIALNMMDEAGRRGIRVDAGLLSRRLGVPVIPTVASKGEGVDALRRALAEILQWPERFAPVPWPAPVQEAVRELRKARPDGTLAEIHRLLFDAELPVSLSGSVAEARTRARGMLEAAGLDLVSAEATLRYRHLDALLEGVVGAADPVRARRPYAVDRVLTHRFWGLVVFSVLMFGVFSSIYWLAQPLMEGIDALKGLLAAWTGSGLEGLPMFRSLVVSGVIEGVGAVVIFLPQILILFLFVAVLEDSGYMARAAFLMDKVFSWTGLNGKSFVPMLSSFACAVPAILATRTIEDPKARLSTILVAPLMSCSARLPIYVLLIGAFIEPVYGPLWAGVALFAMHLLGLVVAIPIAWFINRFILRLRSVPFVLEMPPYRRPRASGVFRRMYFSGREFVVRAGTVIFAFSILIWALIYFPRSEPAGGSAEEVAASRLERSYMGRMGKAVQPVFAPAGFDWKITVAVLAAFPAREVVVSTLGIIYALGEDVDEESADLKGRLAAATWPDGRPVFTPLVAASIMVFFAFCLQCGSTVAVIAREAGWRWAAGAFAYMTALAWVGATAVYQVGSWIQGDV